MHGVSPTRQSPVPSTSAAAAASTAAVASSSLPAKNSAMQQQQQQRPVAAEQQHHQRSHQGRHSGGIYIDNNQQQQQQHQGNKRLAVHLTDGGAERNSQQQQQSLLPPSSAENSRSSPSDVGSIIGSPSMSSANNNNNNLLLMEAQRHFPMQQWNVLNNLALSRATMGHHHLARDFEDSQQQQQQQMMANLQHQQEQRAASHFAYPQLLNATKDRLALPVPSDPKRLVPHNFTAQHQPASLKHHHQQQQQQQHQPAPINFPPSSSGSLDREGYPHQQMTTTYLRPMPPLIPVTATGPLLAATPTSLRSLEQRPPHQPMAGHSSAPDSSAAVPPALRPLDGSAAATHGPPRKSSRFRGGENGSTGDGESSDSRSSSASSSPSLMLTDVMAEVAAVASNPVLPDPLRSTSVIRFAHRPNSSPPSSSSK